MSEDFARLLRERFWGHSHDARDLRAWCDEFGCPPHQVKNTTLQGGVMVVDRRAYFDEGWRKAMEKQPPVKRD
jgi:hypothetical protein